MAEFRIPVILGKEERDEWFAAESSIDSTLKQKLGAFRFITTEAAFTNPWVAASRQKDLASCLPSRGA